MSGDVPPARIATIGYQGAAPVRFIETLHAADVAELVDVRAVPWSRRPEFVQRALAAALAEAGIAYRHLPALGNPEAGRQAAKSGQSYAAIYNAHLDGAPARAAMAALAAEAAGRRFCLMCMERDPAQCHRSLLAARLARDWGLAVEHLHVGAAQLSLF